MGVIFSIVLSIILEYFSVKGSWVSTLLPLPEDLELLINSMYDDGYSAEYLVPDISRDDLAQSDLALSWEKQEDKNPSRDQVLGIIDLDRDGARNQPWVNFSKAVFVPNEIDYKIRARHKFHPHSGRIGGTMQKQEEGYHFDDNIEVGRVHDNQQVFQPQQGTRSPGSTASSGTSESLDFLMPIPEFGTRKESPPKLNKNVLPLKKIAEQKSAPKAILKNYTVPNYHDLSGIINLQKKSEAATKRSTHSNGGGFLGLANLFRNKIRPDNKDNNNNINNNNNGNSIEGENCYTLESLYEKLLRMRNDKDNHYPLRKSEEEKHLMQTAESGDYSHLKRLTALRPIVTHTRQLHPGHRSSYVAHIGPLSAKHYLYSRGSG